jgi:hypothetical protein
MNHGGTREGAGRPKGSIASHTLETQAFRQYIIQQIIANKKELVEALIKKAKSGDIPALRELLDRSLGKVKDSMEILTSPIDEEEKCPYSAFLDEAGDLICSAQTRELLDKEFGESSK